MITYSKPEVFRNVLLSFSLAKHIGQAFGVQGTFILHDAFTFVRPEKVRTKCVCLTPFFIVTFDSFTTGSTLYTILLDNRFRNVIQHHNSILLCRLDRYCYYCSSWSHALKYPSKLMRRLSHSYTGSVGQTCKKKKKWREKKEIEMHLEKRAWKREIASKKKNNIPSKWEIKTGHQIPFNTKNFSRIISEPWLVVQVKIKLADVCFGSSKSYLMLCVVITTKPTDYREIWKVKHNLLFCYLFATIAWQMATIRWFGGRESGLCKTICWTNYKPNLAFTTIFSHFDWTAFQTSWCKIICKSNNSFEISPTMSRKCSRADFKLGRVKISDGHKDIEYIYCIWWPKINT